MASEAKTKKKNKFLPIIIVVLVVGGAVWYFLRGKGAGGLANKAFNGSLKAAVELGVPMKCTYTVEGVEYEGYIKGKQWRGKVKGADGVVSEVIMKDNCMWTWSSEQPDGFKMCFDAVEGEDDMWDQEDLSGLNYYCVPTAVTDAKFEAPADINFMDFGSLMQQYQ